MSRKAIVFHGLTGLLETSRVPKTLVAQFAVRIYREKGGGYRGTMDGWGEVHGQTLAETIQRSRDFFSRVLDGSYPNRTGIDPAGADLIIWFDIALIRRATARAD